MKKILLSLFAVAMMMVGCRTTPEPKPYIIDVRPSPLITSQNHNIHKIAGSASTNHPTLVNNRWPKRVNINLSIDGGLTFARNLGYGIPTENDRLDLDYDYSLPFDVNLITSSAVIQITDLENKEYCRSKNFVIAGLQILSPKAGDTLINGLPIEIEWRQFGYPGEKFNLGYITREGTFTVLDEIDGVVDGTNSFTWFAHGLPSTNAVKLGIQNQRDSVTWNVTGILEVL